MAKIRQMLKNNEFSAWAAEKLEEYRPFDLPKYDEGKTI
jgi:hypothetical protein